VIKKIGVFARPFPRRTHMENAKAFIGVSLDSGYFTRAWVRGALNELSSKHSSVLILLADDVLKFTRTLVSQPGSPKLSFTEADKYVVKRSAEIRRFFESEIRILPEVCAARVRVESWSCFAD